MKNNNILLLLAVVMISGSALLDPAVAQYGYGWGRHGSYASTAEEGIMRGMGDLTRARGERNMMNAEAARTMTDVRSRQMENRIQATETYWERKRINKENRFYSADEKASIRQRNLEKQMFHRARQSQGSRPDAGSLDPVSGSIAWPLALGNPMYDNFRSELDVLFATRADKQGAIGYAGFREIQDLTKSMLKTLDDQFRATEINMREYQDAKKFIKSLELEARHTSA